jgi:hypothetical protein
MHRIRDQWRNAALPGQRAPLKYQCELVKVTGGATVRRSPSASISVTTSPSSRDRHAVAPGHGKALRRWLRVLIVLQSMHTPPGRRGLTHGLPVILAQVRLVGEAAPQRDVTQGRIGRKHVSSGQFHATSHDERVR